MGGWGAILTAGRVSKRAPGFAAPFGCPHPQAETYVAETYAAGRSPD